jgi:hypothetical protein
MPTLIYRAAEAFSSFSNQLFQSMNILQIVSEVCKDCLLTTSEIVVWHHFLLESFPGELRATNGQMCQVQFRRILIEVALLMKKVLNPEQLGYIRAHLFSFKQGAFPAEFTQGSTRETTIGSTSLRRLSKDLNKLRRRVQRREGYNYNWIVDELTK